MTMQRAIDDLANTLERQIENYHELKRLVLEKRKAIMSHDLEELSSITAKIEDLIISNNRVEIGRIALVKKLAEELKISEPKPTLANIARRLESSLAGKLMALRRRAVSAIADVQRQNRINAEMLKYCANLMDSVLRRLVDPESDGSTYGSRGKMKQKLASASLLDQHI